MPSSHPPLLGLPRARRGRRLVPAAAVRRRCSAWMMLLPAMVFLVYMSFSWRNPTPDDMKSSWAIAGNTNISVEARAADNEAYLRTPTSLYLNLDAFNAGNVTSNRTTLENSATINEHSTGFEQDVQANRSSKKSRRHLVDIKLSRKEKAHSMQETRHFIVVL